MNYINLIDDLYTTITASKNANNQAITWLTNLTDEKIKNIYNEYSISINNFLNMGITFYRGYNKKQYPLFEINPKEKYKNIKRNSTHSGADSNLHTLLTSTILDSWKNFPKRNESICFTDSKEVARSYATPYYIFVKNTAKVAYFTDILDFWDIKTINGLSSFSTTLEEWLENNYNTEFDINNTDTITKLLKSIDMKDVKNSRFLVSFFNLPYKEKDSLYDMLNKSLDPKNINLVYENVPTLYKNIQQSNIQHEFFTNDELLFLYCNSPSTKKILNMFKNISNSENKLIDEKKSSELLKLEEKITFYKIPYLEKFNYAWLLKLITPSEHQVDISPSLQPNTTLIRKAVIKNKILSNKTLLSEKQIHFTATDFENTTIKNQTNIYEIEFSELKNCIIENINIHYNRNHFYNCLFNLEKNSTIPQYNDILDLNNCSISLPLDVDTDKRHIFKIPVYDYLITFITFIDDKINNNAKMEDMTREEYLDKKFISDIKNKLFYD